MYLCCIFLLCNYIHCVWAAESASAIQQKTDILLLGEVRSVPSSPTLRKLSENVSTGFLGENEAEAKCEYLEIRLMMVRISHLPYRFCIPLSLFKITSNMENLLNCAVLCAEITQRNFQIRPMINTQESSKQAGTYFVSYPHQRA